MVSGTAVHLSHAHRSNLFRMWTKAIATGLILSGVMSLYIYVLEGTLVG